VTPDFRSLAYCPGVSLRYTPARPCSIAPSSICRLSKVPNASPLLASSLILSASANVVQFESITVEVACSEYSRLLQHYVAALRRWEQAELVPNKSEFADQPARLAAEIKHKVQNERDAAKMRINLHKQSCPVCLNLTNRRGRLTRREWH
jgi:hypothetical protein